MREFGRYAVYFLPERGALYDFGASWLGWDVIDGVAREHPLLDGLPLSVDDLTATPRKYGFHGTIKPPFRLRDEQTVEDLFETFEDVITGLPAVTLDGLQVARLGSFLALRPVGDHLSLAALAGNIVTKLDDFRALPSEAELQRRKSAELTTRQTALLERWGYPYVLDEFKFHLTLTGRLRPDEIDPVFDVLTREMSPLIAGPLTIRSLCLCGEDQDGMFHLIHREMLSG